jgi:hypothetical protein
MECVKDSQSELKAAWDRLALIFLAKPREGFEEEYREAASRELSRLAILCRDGQGHDE